MKLRHPFLISIAARIIARFIRLWVGMARYRYASLGRSLSHVEPGFEGRYIYAFWHECLLLPAHTHSRPNITVLISQHADGELISQVANRLSMRTVRGSSTRGGIRALRSMMKAAAQGHLVVTPDGPRGPRRQVQAGLIYLASRTGLPIVPTGIGYDRPWRAKSWDRFAVPVPFRRAVMFNAGMVHVPRDADRHELEKYRLIVQERMDFVTEQAERLAAGEEIALSAAA